MSSAPHDHSRLQHSTHPAKDLWQVEQAAIVRPGHGARASLVQDGVHHSSIIRPSVLDPVQLGARVDIVAPCNSGAVRAANEQIHCQQSRRQKASTCLQPSQAQLCVNRLRGVTDRMPWCSDHELVRYLTYSKRVCVLNACSCCGAKEICTVQEQVTALDPLLTAEITGQTASECDLSLQPPAAVWSFRLVLAFEPSADSWSCRQLEQKTAKSTAAC